MRTLGASRGASGRTVVDMRVRCRFFFFSSRRRHTRFDCDWSSDVCSSDLRFSGAPPYNHAVDSLFGVRTDRIPSELHVSPRVGFTWALDGGSGGAGPQTQTGKGRGGGRGGCPGGADYLKKKTKHHEADACY